MFARKADDDLASLAGKLDGVVAQNRARKACATVVLLAAKDAVAKSLEKIAREKKLEHVPLTVAHDGEKGPAEYRLSKDALVTIVVYDDKMEVRRVLSFEKLDAKAQDETLAAFAGVLARPDAKKE